MTFRVNGQELAVDIMAVREIRAWTEPTPLPHSASHVRGVINLRGVVLPVVDLACRLGWDQRELTPKHVVIVLSIHGELQGIIVDAVSDILSVRKEDFQHVADADYNDGQDLIEGIATTDTGMVTLLNLEKLSLHGKRRDADRLAA